MISEKREMDLLLEFQTAKAKFEFAQKEFANVIEKIEKIDGYERNIAVISGCCGAYPYRDKGQAAGLCDDCSKVRVVDVHIF